MKNHQSSSRIIVGVLLACVVVVMIAAGGCFGGGEGGESGTTTASTAAGNGGGTGTTSVAVETTVVASVDLLSSFQSKDPFIPQAQLTTTTQPATTVVTIATTTTIAVTTTLRPKLTVTAFPGSGYVAFTIGNDSYTDTFSSFQAGPAVLSSDKWGTIQITAVNDGGATPTAVFLHNGVTSFELGLGASRQL